MAFNRVCGRITRTSVSDKLRNYVILSVSLLIPTLVPSHLLIPNITGLFLRLTNLVG